MARQSRTPRTKPPVGADDLLALRLPTVIAISPNEQLIAYGIEWIDRAEPAYYTNLYLHDRRDRSTRQLTHGKTADGQPVFSPDSSRIAFVSRREKKTGLWIIENLLQPERQLFEVEGSIGDLQWTPDQSELLFSLQYSDAHFISDERKKKEAPVYREITRLLYRLDGAGYLPKSPRQICALSIADKKLRIITKGKRDNHSPNLSHDGRQIVFVSNRAADPDLNDLHDDLFVIPFSGGKERRIPTPAGPKVSPKFSPNGRLVAYIGHTNLDDAWGVANSHVWLVGTSGRPEARDLMPKFDRCAEDQTIADLADVHDAAVLYWSGDGRGDSIFSHLIPEEPTPTLYR